MSELSGTVPVPATIEEYHATGHRPLDLADIAGHQHPLVIRGLVRNWLVVKLARQSDTAFAQRLAEPDNGTDVTTLLLSPEADGIIGYTPDLDGFSYRRFKVPGTLGVGRLAYCLRSLSAGFARIAIAQACR